MRDTREVEDIYGTPELTAILERVVVSPATGKFHPHPPEIFTTEGEWVNEGETLGEIHNGGEPIAIVSSFTGWIMGMLAISGQPVATGDQLFWIRP